MNGLQCNVTEIDLHRSSGQTTDSADPDFQKPLLVPGNGTSGSKQPFYWFQNKSNNIFEGIFAPLSYLDLYNFLNGVQGDIFEDPCITIPAPGPNQTVLPLLNRAVAIPGQVLKFTNAALVNVTGLSIASAPGAGSIAPSIPSTPPASLISQRSPSHSLRTLSRPLRLHLSIRTIPPH
ncbi:hypothetical protein BJY52DRAFT_704721 [Lactarius psammicola]|nr:hypothetical protein BJY52DRAFT_704721 [Lactarius psammicola]